MPLAETDCCESPIESSSVAEAVLALVHVTVNDWPIVTAVGFADIEQVGVFEAEYEVFTHWLFCSV